MIIDKGTTIQPMLYAILEELKRRNPYTVDFFPDLDTTQLNRALVKFVDNKHIQQANAYLVRQGWQAACVELERIIAEFNR